MQKTITDRNGVRSTRWVKPEAVPKKMLQSLPAPRTGIASSESHEAKVERAIEIFLKDANGITPADGEIYDEYANEERDKFSSFDSATLDEIIGASRAHISGLSSIIDDSHNTIVIRDYLNLPPDLIETVGVTKSAHLMKAMELYFLRETPNPNTVYPETRGKQCASLALLAHTLNYLIADGDAPKESFVLESVGELRWAEKISDNRLAQIALDRYNDTDRVVDFMKTRKTNDVDRILEMLDSESPAVAEGIL